MHFYITPELKEIAKTISCQFVDANTTSKDFVRKYYLFNRGLKSKDFYSVENSLCIRRLLQIMVGLQSEILVEKEIFLQVCKGIDQGFLDSKISKEQYKGLQNLISIAQ